MTARLSRAAADARDDILRSLKADHRRVRKAYRDAQALDPAKEPEAYVGLVEQVLAELTVHAELEESLLYPAARAVVEDPGLIDEAEVEHESMKTLISQIQGLDLGDPKYQARFVVLCEYVIHHVKEEEHELFTELEGVRLDWESLAAQMRERRAALGGEPVETETAAA
ncbi:hemerythrin domain-containing protein [Piscinibacter sakaiensis]|uniref:Regulator of cell morphogenesis and NO signaling n=1 Tax=Piscinibacter sakaiensis TaxID=1547922 RepID=A0A0K8P994_PISS1|nr:hemerythrin domain-containing protein [Piscinibacter sakaiensis]GAP38760.1 regulator of cell morphogenesis and NO signaling [Piscinibacter sakaiensis]